MIDLSFESRYWVRLGAVSILMTRGLSA
jgi:hypothetical protein